MNLSLLKQGTSTSIEQGIFQIYSLLKQQPTLEPTALVNCLFDQLVKKVSTSSIGWETPGLNTKFLELMKLGLNTLCARGEACLERYWAKHFLSRDQMDWNDLKDFPYFNNYQLLSEWEYSLLKDYLSDVPKSILFVGSGCLPLSAMFMAKQHSLIVDCMEIDGEAVNISRTLIKKVGLNRKVKVIHTDFFETTDFSHYDAVFVAALVGINEFEKRKVLIHLKKNLTTHQTFLTRSATGLKTLLYQEVNLAWFSDFRDVKLLNPENLEIINSVILAKK